MDRRPALHMLALSALAGVGSLGGAVEVEPERTGGRWHTYGPSAPARFVTPGSTRIRGARRMSHAANAPAEAPRAPSPALPHEEGSVTTIRSHAVYSNRMPRFSPKPCSAEVLCSQPTCLRAHTRRCAVCRCALCPGCVRLGVCGALVCPADVMVPTPEGAA